MAVDYVSQVLGGYPQLPIEDIMSAYQTQQRSLLSEYLPQLRTGWAERGLLRSGMTAAQELEATRKASENEAMFRAGLVEKQWQGDVNKWMTEFQGELQKELAKMGYSAQEQQSIWSGMGSLLGVALPWILGVPSMGIEGLF